MSLTQGSEALKTFLEGARPLVQHTLIQETPLAVGTVAKTVSDDEGFVGSFFGIPVLQVGTGLGIDNAFLRLAVDVLADPLNFIGGLGFATKGGRAAAAARHLPAGKRLANLEKLGNSAAFFIKEPAKHVALIEAAKAKDIRTVGKLLKEASLPQAELKAIFKGPGRADLLRALDLASKDALPDVAVGLAKRVKEGQASLLRFRVPIADTEFVPFQSFQAALAEQIEAIPKVGAFFQKRGLKASRDIQRAWTTASNVEHVFNNVLRLRETVSELRASGDTKATAIANKLDRSIKLATPRLDEYLRLRGAALLDPQNARTERGLLNLARESDELIALASKSAEAGHMGPFARLLSRIGSLGDIAATGPVGETARTFLGKLAGTLDDTVGPGLSGLMRALKERVQSVVDVGTNSGLRGRLNTTEVRGMVESELRSKRELLQRIEGVQKERLGRRVQRELAGERRLAESVLSEQDIREFSSLDERAILNSPLGRAKAEQLREGTRIKTATQQRLRGEISNLERLLNLLPTQRVSLGKAVPEMLRLEGDVNRIMGSLVGTFEKLAPELRQFSPEFRNRFGTALASLPGTLQAIGQGLRNNKALFTRINALLKREFPEGVAATGALKTIREGFGKAIVAPPELVGATDDVIAGINPAAAAEFGGQGRVMPGILGTRYWDFNPMDKARTHFAWLTNMARRVEAWVLHPLARTFEKELLAGGDAAQLAWLRAIEKPQLLEKLPETQRAFAMESRRLLNQFGEIAFNEGWIRTEIDDYFPRIFKFSENVSDDVIEATKVKFFERVRGRTTVSFGRPRVHEYIDGLLELEKAGLGKLERNPVQILKRYMDSMTEMAFKQRLLNDLTRSRSWDGRPMLVPKEKLGRLMASIASDASDIDVVSYITLPTPNKIPVLSNYAIHPDAKFILKMFGPQTMMAAIRESPKFFRSLQEFNLTAKAAVLTSSLFHATALNYSLLFTLGPKAYFPFLGSQLRQVRRNTFLRNVIGPGKERAELAQTKMALWGEAADAVEYATLQGLELDTFEGEIASHLTSTLEKWSAQAKGALKAGQNAAKFVDDAGKTRDVLRSPLTALAHVNDKIQSATWNYIHNTGKLLAFNTMLVRMSKKFPEKDFDVLARQVAASVNASMGGLSWRTMFGDARVRAGLQFFMLAPDWTASNLIIARDVFMNMVPNLPKNAQGLPVVAFRDLIDPGVAAAFARKYWFNAAASLFVMKQLLNYAFTGHSTFDNPEGRWYDVYSGQNDPTTKKPIYLMMQKQIREPFEAAKDPLTFLQRKASPLFSLSARVISQRDPFGAPIATPEDSSFVRLYRNFGWAISGLLPIPFSQTFRAFTRAAEGKARPFEFANIITSQFDARFRASNEPSATTLPRDQLPPSLVPNLDSPRLIRRLR